MIIIFIDEVHGRPTEWNLDGAYERIRLLLSWSEPRRYSVCHTTAVPIELNFYIIISHIIFIFAVSRVLDNVILKFDANA